MPSRKRSSEFSSSPSQGQTDDPCPSSSSQPPPKTVIVANNAASFYLPGVSQEREAVRYRKGIFEICPMRSDPRAWPKQVDVSFGGFLKKCALCCEELSVHQDKYMYGNLGAYCSPECRDREFVIDALKGRVRLATQTASTGSSVSKTS